jgi:hypothetical protein
LVKHAAPLSFTDISEFFWRFSQNNFKGRMTSIAGDALEVVDLKNYGAGNARYQPWSMMTATGILLRRVNCEVGHRGIENTEGKAKDGLAVILPPGSDIEGFPSVS